MTIKKRKIIDCFFYYDEIEMLEYRLSELSDNVDYFIIIESEMDFLLNKKPSFLNLDDEKIIRFKDKIIHFFIPSIDLKSLNDFYKEKKYINYLEKVRNNGLNKDDLLQYIIYYFLNYLISLDFFVEDIVIFSDIDEIPDFSIWDNVSDNLKFGPVVLKQKNFLWSPDFYLPYDYYGPIVFMMSHIISNQKFVLELYKKKGVEPTSNISIKCGWHFSHFYSIERIINKISLIKPELNLKREVLIDGIQSLKNPVPNNLGFYEELIENDTLKFPRIKKLPSLFIGRVEPKKILVNLTDFDLKFSGFDYTITYKFNSEDFPKEIYYGNSDLDFFQYKFKLNEINKKLKSISPLNIDIFVIIFESNVNENEINLNSEYVSSDKKYAVFKWKTLKNNILSDLIGL